MFAARRFASTSLKTPATWLLNPKASHSGTASTPLSPRRSRARFSVEYFWCSVDMRTY